MKKKIGTLMEERLVQKARSMAASRQVPLHQIFEDAMESYFEQEHAEPQMSLEDVLSMKPASSPSTRMGKGAGDFSDEDID